MGTELWHRLRLVPQLGRRKFEFPYTKETVGSV